MIVPHVHAPAPLKPSQDSIQKQLTGSLPKFCHGLILKMQSRSCCNRALFSPLSTAPKLSLVGLGVSASKHSNMLHDCSLHLCAHPMEGHNAYLKAQTLCSRACSGCCTLMLLLLLLRLRFLSHRRLCNASSTHHTHRCVIL